MAEWSKEQVADELRKLADRIANGDLEKNGRSMSIEVTIAKMDLGGIRRFGYQFARRESVS